MSAPQQDADLRHVLGVLRRRGWLIVAIVGVVVVVAFVWVARQPTQYQAVSKVRISNPNANNVFNSSGQASVDPKRLVETETQVLQSNDLKQSVRQQLGGDGSLVGVVEIANPPDTDVLAIAVRSTSPEVARDAANAYTKIYIDTRVTQRVGELNARAAELRRQADDLAAKIAALPANDASRNGLQTSQGNFTNLAAQAESEATLLKANIQVVDTAQLPDDTITPNRVWYALVAVAAALLFAVWLAFALDRMDDRIRGPEAFDDPALDGLGGDGGAVSILGAIANGGASLPTGERGPTLAAYGSKTMEPYQAIASSLRFSVLGRDKRVLLVASGKRGEDKSSVAANLAVALAQDGLHVVLVSADLRKPAIGGAFGVTETTRAGLSDLLSGQPAELVQVKTDSQDLLDLMPAGALPANPAGLLGQPKMGEFVTHLRAAGFDYIIIDGAPLLDVGDSRALVGLVDGVVLVARQGRTRQRELRESLSLLGALDADVVGVVLTGARAAGRRVLPTG